LRLEVVGAFPTIVDPNLFAAAPAVLARRKREPTKTKMLTGLKELYRAWLIASFGAASFLLQNASREPAILYRLYARSPLMRE